MTWRLDVAPEARPLLAALDPSLREELLEHAATLADDPLPQMRHSGLGDEPRGALVYEYQSDVITNLRVRLFFSDLDLAKKKMALVAVTTTGGSPDHAPQRS